MRGENRDYIPRRQPGVSEQTCPLDEGCAFKATSERRDAHYRRKQGKKDRPAIDGMGFPVFGGMDY